MLEEQNWADKVRTYVNDAGLSLQGYAQSRGIPASTFKDWLKCPEKLDVYKKRNPEAFRRLYEDTKLDVLNPSLVNVFAVAEDKSALVPEDGLGGIAERLDALLVEIGQVRRQLPGIEERVSRPLVAETKKLFYDFLERLERFKRADPDSRKQLVEAIPVSDIGYVTAFLRALYQSEDKFQSWLFSSNYVAKGGKV